MSGSTIGSVVGGVVGFYFGGPAGAQAGIAIGGAIGGAVDPTKIKGPKLNDASVQTSQEGVPIPWGYGTFPCAGNVIWADVLVEHEQEEGGKGSGTVAVNYTYTRSYAVGICEGPITGIQQIKRNGKIVYDISPTSTTLGQNAKFLAKCTMYLGDETQLVDPTIEAVVGVGNTAPYRGLAYIVLTDDDLTDTAGGIAQYEFVVQMCGTLTSTAAPGKFIGSGGVGFAETSATGATWPDQSSGLSGVSLRFLAASDNKVVGSSTSGQMYRSSDRGVIWAASTTVTNYAITDIEYGNGLFVGVTDAGTVVVSADDGDTWAESTPAHTIVGDSTLAFGDGKFVMAVGVVGLTGGGVYYSVNGTAWTLALAQNMIGVGWNGSHFMVVGDSGACYTSPTGAVWTYGSSPGGAQWSFITVTGGPGFFLAGTNAGTGSIGIYKSTDLGVTWTHKGASGGYSRSAGGDGVFAFAESTGPRYSLDSGEAWAAATGGATVTDIAYSGPSPDWYAVPDADGAYVDEDGNLVTDYVSSTSLSSCGAYLDEIVLDLCERAGIAASEVDVTDLASDFVAGYKCATEAGAEAFIAPLMPAFFFDAGEWDKKLRFVKRGGASVAALTMDDLVARDGPAIEQTRIQEVELLRKVNVMTLDPDAEYRPTKQSAERRSGTVIAKGERTFEVPLVTSGTLAAQMAEIQLKASWSETDRLAYALSLKWSKLTATDVVTLTDADSKAHRLRLTRLNEDGGIFEIEDSVKDRAATYVSAAVGVVNTNTPTPTTGSGLTGPTLFAAMNLPQMRTQDISPGMYIGACGLLAGWPGCQILMSVDGGVSYSVALTIINPTRMGMLTAAITSSGTPLSVHVFGGALSSKTTAQVAAGANYSAILSGAAAEVVAYETATESTANYYDLTVLTRAIEGTTAASHAVADQFMDLSTAYFLPISQAYAGQTIYFKAVGAGVSADAVTAVAVVFDGSTYIHDGGVVAP